MGEDSGPRPILICRWCQVPVRRASGGDGPLGKVMHEGGGEKCADEKHIASPIESRTDLDEVARRVTKRYPDYQVTVSFGFLLRACLRVELGVTAVPVEATTEDELVRRIEHQIRMAALSEVLDGEQP